MAEPSQEGQGKRATRQPPEAPAGAGPIPAGSGEGASLHSLLPVPGVFCYYLYKMEQLEASSARSLVLHSIASHPSTVIFLLLDT